jgi:hypothetical protein
VSSEALIRRVERLEQREEIRRLAAVYCQLLDRERFDELGETFAADGELLRNGESAARGREDLRSFYEKARSGFTLSFHYPHSHIIDFVGTEEATGVVSAHAEMGIAGRLVIAGLRYEDAYVREEGCWRFARRDVGFLYRADWGELERIIAAPAS